MIAIHWCPAPERLMRGGRPGVHGVSPPSWPCLRVTSSYEHNAQEEPRHDTSQQRRRLTPCTPASRPERHGEEVGGEEGEVHEREGRVCTG